VKRVVIEATGVAQPGELLEVLSDPALRGSVEVGPVVTVVDSAKFAGLRRVLGGFYAEQVQRADVVILNKADLTDSSRLDEVRRTIAGLNPKATVVTADHCNVELDMVLDGQRRAPEPSALEQGLASPAPAASFVSFVVPADFDSTRTAVEQFFASLPSEIMRAKGFMKIDGQLATVQFATGQLEITPAAGSRPLTMVFISNAEPNRTAVAEALGRTRRS